MGDAFVPASGEEFGDFASALNVGRGDRGMPRPVLAAVEHDDRNACGGAVLREVRGHANRGSDNPVDLVVDEFLYHFLGGLSVVACGEDQDVIALFLKGF